MIWRPGVADIKQMAFSPPLKRTLPGARRSRAFANILCGKFVDALWPLSFLRIAHLDGETAYPFHLYVYVVSVLHRSQPLVVGAHE